MLATTTLVNDKEFELFMPWKSIQERVKLLGEQITRDYVGKKPLLIGVLNGSVVFMADLIRYIDLPLELSFIKVASYSGTSSTGKVKQILGLHENVFKRDVIIVEDIVDSGFTMAQIMDDFAERGASSIQVATLLFKKEALKKELTLKYVGFEIPNKFVVGYGLDYDGFGRNLNHIYQLSS
jgi:hypoxanthine phosphoribosyltransferase